MNLGGWNYLFYHVLPKMLNRVVFDCLDLCGVRRLEGLQGGGKIFGVFFTFGLEVEVLSCNLICLIICRHTLLYQLQYLARKPSLRQPTTH